MRKRLLIILSIILLFSAAVGCSAEVANETTTAAVTTTSATVATTSTTAASTTQTTSTTKATTKATKATTKATKASTKAAKATSTSTTKKEPKTHSQAQSFCYITVECKSINDNMDKLKEGHESFVPKDGIIIGKTKCTFKEGNTVYDILEKVCKNKGIKLTARDTVYGIYVEGINNLDEFDCGSASGWVYTVNSKSPPKSCGKYTVSKNDEIVFSYVVN